MAAKTFLKHLSLASASSCNTIHIFYFLCRECICLGSECCLVWNTHFKHQIKLNKHHPNITNSWVCAKYLARAGTCVCLSSVCSHPHRSLQDPVLLETIKKDPQNSQTGWKTFYLVLWLCRCGLGLYFLRTHHLCELKLYFWVQNPLTVISRLNSMV